jgi:glycosyltransferase involved in cell wall biosynthesis
MGAARGNNLGVPGYSYDLVARLFLPLLSRWGEVIQVARDPARIEATIREARQRGLQPILFSFLPFQDVYLTPSASNVVVPFWEYPDVPGEAFDGNPQNNWTTTANRCDLILVVGDFTAEALRRAGVRTPIRIVPTPTPDDYFAVPPWRVDRRVRISCSAYVFPNADAPADERWDAPDPVGQHRSPPPRASLKRSLLGLLRRTYPYALKPLIPPIVHEVMRKRARHVGDDPWHRYLRSCWRDTVELSGVVYTSIFSPGDTRKNWQDLLSGFVSALGDREDATLVVKLAAADSVWIDRILHYYRTVGLTHRCKIVFIADYLSAEQMLALVEASAYYLTTTRAEGCCLPLLNYLAAGRPGITPCHSAIKDYFTPELGFIIQGGVEKAFWPQDKRARIKTSWTRLVWPSVVEQIRKSYEVAKHNRPDYENLASRCRDRISQWVGTAQVWPRLQAALDLLDESERYKKKAS